MEATLLPLTYIKTRGADVRQPEHAGGVCLWSMPVELGQFSLPFRDCVTQERGCPISLARADPYRWRVYICF